MAQSGSEVSDNAREQAACIQETSASLEEISATTRQNADRAGEADRLMQTSRQTVERAATAMNDLTSSMNLISKSSNQVAGVLKNIDEIAFHTNILALNAAAEAARTSGAIIEQTVTDVAKGVSLVNHAHAAFEEVAATIGRGTQIVSQIASSSGEQALGIANIGTSITRIESLAQRNVINARQTADGASEMTSRV